MRHAVVLRVLASFALALAVGPVAARAQGTLVVQNSTEPPGLDLTATPASATAGVVLYNVQECLVKVDRHGRLVPWLAERWHTTDDRNYTFFLKRGVRFHNGRELRAADVKYVFDRAMNPETKHPYPGYYAAIGDIIVKDDYTITFALKSLNANFLLNLARQGSVIYPREAVDTLKSEPIGTGPFRLAEWVRGDRIVLVRNPEYHAKSIPRLDKIVFRFIPDPNAALAALKAGDVDASLFGLGPEHVQELQKDPRFQVIVGDTTNDVILAMNNSRKPYADVRVRRAITHAINKADVLKGAMFGMGRILGSNVDPLNPYFVDLAGAMPYDQARAKKLLAEAGYPNGFEAVLKVSPQYYYAVRSGEIIADQLQKVGIRLKIEQIEWGQ
jgi:peptide/nickel transport system substrate-binding protein